ncbi:hypothetical protein EIP86_004734 [Pleurotus ostreatoroseus]|nr:hypothetical protein EIP86_004734 [Pleurotus ostreatoroseus]
MSSSRRSKKRAHFHVAEPVHTGISETYDLSTSNRRVRRRRNVDNVILTEPVQPEPTPSTSQLPHELSTPWEDDCQPEEIDHEATGIKIRARSQKKRYESTVWTDNHFVRKSLYDLELVVQLGHEGRGSCLQSVLRQLVVIHTNGIHKVHANFCECQPGLERRVQLMRQGWWPATSTEPRTCATFDALRLFHHVNLQGHLNAFDFYRALENMTDPWHLEKLPDRLASFMIIIRQYRNVKALKRAGRQYADGGVDATKCGDLALRCRACPHPNKTLPKNWEKVPPEYA